MESLVRGPSASSNGFFEAFWAPESIPQTLLLQIKPLENMGKRNVGSLFWGAPCCFPVSVGPTRNQGPDGRKCREKPFPQQMGETNDLWGKILKKLNTHRVAQQPGWGCGERIFSQPGSIRAESTLRSAVQRGQNADPRVLGRTHRHPAACQLTQGVWGFLF